MNQNIPENYRLNSPIHHDTYLIDGKIGKDALALWTKYDHERPDYSIYVKRMNDREKKEKKLPQIKNRNMKLCLKNIF